MGALAFFYLLPVLAVISVVQEIVKWAQTVTLNEAVISGMDWITQFFQNTDFNAIGNGIADFINQIGSLFG